MFRIGIMSLKFPAGREVAYRMSRFFSDKYMDLKPYTPGEQPKDQQNIVKLNTNENPYPPLPEVAKAVAEASGKLYLYSDTECTKLRKLLAERLGRPLLEADRELEKLKV